IPEGTGSLRVPDSAGPVRMTALVFPFAEAMGNLYSVRSLFRDLFPKAFSSTIPKDGFGSGVGDGSRGQIICSSEEDVRTEVRTPLTEQSQIQNTSPGGDVFWIPFCAPEVTFRSGQRGPLECDFYRAKNPYAYPIYNNFHAFPLEIVTFLQVTRDYFLYMGLGSFGRIPSWKAN
ncbi:MAG: hypothetical protein ACMUHU_04775, partial [Thermoplasmatota archaeon]